MTTPVPTSAQAEKPKKSNCFLWGCLTVILLGVISVCCLGTLILLPVFTNFDPLGTNLRDRINQVFPWQDFLENPSQIPGLPEDLLQELEPYMEDVPDLNVATPGAQPADRPATDARSIPLSSYTATDFPATFSYPTGWDVEPEEYGVTFYNPDSYVYLFVGEYLVDSGMSAQEVAQQVLDSVQEDAQEGSFRVFESSPWQVPTGDDAYLIAFEYVDSDGYYQWVFDLETVSGESNVYFYLSGEDAAEATLYGELIEIIGESFHR
jgi:hypothetical protein